MPFESRKKVCIDSIEEPIRTIDTSMCSTLSCIMRKRRSVRKYLKKDVSGDVLRWILEAASTAPSAGNYQPWEFIVVRNESTRCDLASASYNQNWMLEAPVMIVACVNMRLAAAVYGERGARLYGIQAVAAAIENIMLMAQALDLGTCWVGAFAETVVSRLLQCPDYVRPCAIITLGYPAETPKIPSKHPINEIVHMEKFGESLNVKKVAKEKRPTYMKFQ